MEIVDDFFRTQPFLAAFMAASFKASAADFLAQTSSRKSEGEDQESISLPQRPHRSKRHSQERAHAIRIIPKQSMQPLPPVNMNRNLAFLLYGGLYQGMFLQFLYTFVYPWLYGNHPHQIVLQVHTEICLFGPIITLPLAYILRSIIDYDPQEMNKVGTGDAAGVERTLMNQVLGGIHKYKDHVMTEGLLLKYWSVWAPAQTINFILIPPHLRVVFVAVVSFFWVYLLSMISSGGVTQLEGATESRKGMLFPTTSTTHRQLEHRRVEEQFFSWLDEPSLAARMGSLIPLNSPLRE
jgi:Mpv17 / PMP22 family